VVCSVERIFLLDTHRAGIAGILKHTKKITPNYRAHAGNAVAPPLGVIDRINAAGAQNGPENLGIFQVDIVNLVDKVAGGLNRIHELAHEMRWIVLQADIW